MAEILHTTHNRDLRIGFDRLDSKVPLRIHVGLHYDETAEICHWHVPEKHYLESWGDARAYDGTVSLIQPLIEPLYAGKSACEVLQLFARDNFEKNDRDIVREYWQGRGITGTPAAASTPAPSANGDNGNTAPAATPAAASSASFEDNWRKALHDGVIANSALPARSVSVNTAFFGQPDRIDRPRRNEIAILPDPSVYDGRFTNNGWMQELPNPLTKITWENVALISPATAKKLGVNRGNDPREISGGERGTAFINTHGNNMGADVVNLTYQGQELKGVPMWIAPDSLTIAPYIPPGGTRRRVGNGLGYNVTRFAVRCPNSVSGRSLKQENQRRYPQPRSISIWSRWTERAVTLSGFGTFSTLTNILSKGIRKISPTSRCITNRPTKSGMPRTTSGECPLT